jgi:hypothetical protein
MTMMWKQHGLKVVGVVVVGWLAACASAAGDNRVIPENSTGGSSGSAGQGGFAQAGTSSEGGKAGTSGSSGTAGQGGASSGSAGSAGGSAGQAGTAGESGTAGAAGGVSGGAGAGGSAMAGGAGTAGMAGSSGGTGLSVVSTEPPDGTQAVSPQPLLSITWSSPLNPATVTTNNNTTACTGSLQLSSDNFQTCVPLMANPQASNNNQTFAVVLGTPLASMKDYVWKATTAIKSAMGQSLAADFTSAMGFKTRYFHTIAMSSSNDFTAEETFMTSTTGFAAYVAWDANFLYLGMENADISSGQASKWVLAYLGGDPGTTTGVKYNGQQPTLPFSSKYHVRWKADKMFTDTQLFQGSTWQNASWDFTGDVVVAGNLLKLRIPLADIGSPKTLSLVMSMLNEGQGVEASFASLPSDSFTNGFNPSYSHFYTFDLQGSIYPNAHLSQ